MAPYVIVQLSIHSGIKVRIADKIFPNLFLTFIGVLVVGFSQVAIAESSDDTKESLTFPLNQLPRPDHIVIVVEENKPYKKIIGNLEARYINQLANEGALFTNSFAITHPSQPNYLALFSGSTHGVSDNRCPASVSGENLASQLQKKQLSFGIYSESMPSIGFSGCLSTNLYYARKHNPAVNWQGINISPKVNMPFSKFPSDYTGLPTVSMVIPNLINDMHGDKTRPGSISQGDFWLKSNLDAYVQWAKTNNSLLIVTWDEDDSSADNHIPTIFIGPMVKPGVYNNKINHFNVLRTIIDMYGLSLVGDIEDVKPIVEVWEIEK